MINIRPVTDLRNKFSEIEEKVAEGEPVYLTKNGYGTMVVLSIEEVVLSIEEYSRLTSLIDEKLSEAEIVASSNPKRYTHDEVFGKMREYLSNGK